MKRLDQKMYDVKPEVLGLQAFSSCGPTLTDVFGLSTISSFECEEIILLKLFSD